MKMIKRGAAFLLALILLSSLLPAALAEGDTYIPTTYSTAPKSSVWKTYKASLHYFYNQLTENEKRAFSSRYDSIALGKPELWVLNNFNLSDKEYRRVWHALVYDTPELMLGDSQYSAIWPDVSWYSFSGKVATVSAAKLIAHSKKISGYLKKTKTVLNKIKKSKSYGKTAYAHQLALDRYMVKNCKYKLDTKYDRTKVNYNLRAAFSVFVTKKAVCEGYARAAELALRYFGIPCIYVYGRGNGEAHAWNMVKLGKYWYHYDPTWQDADKTQFYNDYFPYFNVTEKLITRDHTIDKEAKTKYGFTLPNATKTTHDYYSVNKKLLGKNWKKKLVSLLKAARKSKKKVLGVRFSSAAYRSAALKAMKKNQIRPGFSYSWYPDLGKDALVLYIVWK